MASIKEIPVSINEVAKNLTVNITIKGLVKFKIRLWIMKQVLWLLCFVSPCNVDVYLNED